MRQTGPAEVWVLCAEPEHISHVFSSCANTVRRDWAEATRVSDLAQQPRGPQTGLHWAADGHSVWLVTLEQDRKE